jgi:hypothetical protein
MNFSLPTLKSALFAPTHLDDTRFSLLTLAKLRTGIASAGSWLRCAAVMTTSATPMSFFSTTPLFFGFFAAIFPSCLFAGLFQA